MWCSAVSNYKSQWVALNYLRLVVSSLFVCLVYKFRARKGATHHSHDSHRAPYRAEYR